MKAEIIAIGTELLLGQIVNTNARYLAKQCASLGIDTYFQTVVGDNQERIRQALDTARGRADLIICTGGLGPTQDDLTKDALADYLGKKLVIDAPSLDKIREVFRTRGVHMAESNVRQAHLLEGAVPLPNDVGLAVGLAMTERGTHYMLLPGPPREMAPMFENYGKPWLKTVLPDAQPLYSLMLKFAGIGESALEEALADLIERQSDPTLAPYASEGEVTIRLTTRARSREEAERKMRPTEAIIRERVGAHLYATEDIPLEEAIVRRLAAIGKTFAAAESCTGGLIAQLATNVPGSSAVFCGGIVCYTNEVKHRLLDVPTDLLEGEQAPGAVSGETAARLAEQARKRLGSDFAISVTGVAGPSASEGKPVGLVYIGIAAPGRSVRVAKFHFNGNRETIRMKAAKQALYELWQTIGEPSGGA